MIHRPKRLGEWLAMLLIWLGLLLLFAALNKNFLTLGTLGALANRIPTLAVVAAGMTLVLVIGAIDLSVGSILGLCGAILGVAIAFWEWPFWAAALLAVAAGATAGLLNGFISVRLAIPSFIVTLGMLEAARGLAYLVTHSQTQYIGSSVESLSAPIRFLGVSPAFFIAVAITLSAQVVLVRTVWGRVLVAVGSNEAAVRLAGLNPRPSKIAVFMLSGALTGLGAVFYTSRLGASDPNAGAGLELSAIAAVVIGGTSLMGGRGSVINSFFGVLIIATLESGLAQAGASEPVKRVVTGLVIVLAVVLDAWRNHLAARGFPLLRRWFSRH